MSPTCGLYPSKHKVKVIMNINISKLHREGRGWFLLSIETSGIPCLQGTDGFRKLN